jgi:hypothetical protein
LSSINACVLVIILLSFSFLFVFTALHNAYGLSIFSKDDKPFGKSYDDWTAEYWKKYLAKNTDQATPKPGGCLVVNNDYKSQPIVMLMPLFDVNFPPAQSCQISSNQGIMVPLWAGWADHDNPGSCSVINLQECARLENLGNIASDMKVDGIPVAKLNVRLSVTPGMSMTHLSGSFDYKINSLTNATQSTSKVFTLTLPPDSVEIANNVPGTWQAASDGWWVFLKPLPPGQHTISYNLRVTPTGALTSPGTIPHFADITYRLQVVK